MDLSTCFGKGRIRSLSFASGNLEEIKFDAETKIITFKRTADDAIINVHYDVMRG
jgi:hypothetical protein